MSQPAKELSGGNQQKVVFAKALLTEPSIWLCDEPTQAVDVATRQEIHRLLREEAKKGKAVLYVSSDLTELLEVADEVAVMAYGRVRKTFENKDLKPTDVLACCYEAEREENDR
ncbi:MAG: ATP-binding cassette domain-containing protein [Pilosibacter sp.]